MALATQGQKAEDPRSLEREVEAAGTSIRGQQVELMEICRCQEGPKI